MSTIVLAGCGAHPSSMGKSARRSAAPTRQALTWVARHPALLGSVHGGTGLQGPSRITGRAPYSTTVQTSEGSYTVSVWETTSSLPINRVNPAHPAYLRARRPIASWSVEYLPITAQASKTSPYAGLLPGGFIAPTGSGKPISIARHVAGTQYASGTQPGGAVGNTLAVPFILWHDGPWTVECFGPAALTMAKTTAQALRQHPLPAAQKGLLVVGNQHPGQPQPFSYLTWYHNAFTLTLSDPAPNAANIQETLAMAASWRAWPGLAHQP